MKKNKKVLIFIFFIAIGLRLNLAIVNRAANDNHIDVINLIVDEKKIPEKNECWSCFQPKLFYLISAGFIKIFHYKVPYKRIITSQLVNVLLAFFTILLFWKFLEKQTLNSSGRLLIFAFFALNPCLAAINIQGTNDTLVIFCGTGALYFADGFFRSWTKREFVLMTISIIAGCLAKATGLLCMVVIFTVFLLKIMTQDENKKRLVLIKYGLILIISFFTIVPLAGGYYSNYTKYDSLTLSTWNKDSPPSFFEPTFISRPGVTDMFHAWFTFRYIDMIRQPYITNDLQPNALHRTSLWSQLYGRTMFLHFDQWPQSWQTQEMFIITIGRILLLLGIIPLFLFLKGFFLQTVVFIKGVFRDTKTYLRTATNYLHLAAVVVFLLSSVYYSYNFRDFSAMKSIYIFPGMISYIKLFSDGYLSIKNKKVLAVLAALLIIICVCFTIDLSYLLYQLINERFFIK